MWKTYSLKTMKHRWKKLKKTQTNGKASVSMDRKTASCQAVKAVLSDLQIQCNLSQNPRAVFCRKRKPILKFVWNCKVPA